MWLTCAEWFAQQPAILAVHEKYRDYKRGALGPVGALPYPLLVALRALEAEFEAEEDYINGRLYAD